MSFIGSQTDSTEIAATTVYLINTEVDILMHLVNAMFVRSSDLSSELCLDILNKHIYQWTRFLWYMNSCY